MNKTALITGASSGIGLELARYFAREGHNVVLIARRNGRLQTLKKEIESHFKVSATVMSLDLTERDAPIRIRDALLDANIHIDFLVNNAGFGSIGEFPRIAWEKQAKMIDLNVRVLTELTHLFIPMMIEKKSGRILNLASTASFQPGPNMAVYFASKAYVLSFSEALAQELAGTGITVTASCPGPTITEFQSTAGVSRHNAFMNNRYLPHAKDVAEFSYKSMMKGKRVAVHGNLNQVLASTVGLVPRTAVTKITHWLTKQF